MITQISYHITAAPAHSLLCLECLENQDRSKHQQVGSIFSTETLCKRMLLLPSEVEQNFAEFAIENLSILLLLESLPLMRFSDQLVTGR